MTTPSDVKRAVRGTRLPGESLNAQAHRLGVPYVTLYWMNKKGLIHRNPELRRAYWPKFGLVAK